MKFIQIIEFKTSRPDEVKQAMDEFLEKNHGSLHGDGYICKDRDNEGSYANVIIFNSYEEAMRNNDNPAVHELSETMMKLTDGPPTFRNLDVQKEDHHS
jgi:hypothetical protein